MLRVSVLVLILTILCIVFMKNAIDCANNSKAAVNKMKDLKAKMITEKLQKENLIQNNVESSD